MSGSRIPRPDINADVGGGSRKGKKKGTFSLFKTALFMIRGPEKSEDQKIKSNEQNEHQVVALTENLTKLVGSMRPLHLQDNIDSPTTRSLPSLSPSPSVDDLVRPRASSSSSSSPSWGTTMSQYASANNLQELDECDEEEDPDEVFDATSGDDMIDSKAEQFIARFYQQMKRQNVGSIFDR